MSRESSKSSFIFNSYFYEIVRRDENNYKKISKFWKNENLYNYNHIIIPINIDNIHWIMVDISLQQKKIYFYDSYQFTSNRDIVFKNLTKVFSDYINNSDCDFCEWVYIDVNCPKQSNSLDCGVFMCMFINYISRDQIIDFSQEDIEYFRILIGIELLD